VGLTIERLHSRRTLDSPPSKPPKTAKNRPGKPVSDRVLVSNSLSIVKPTRARSGISLSIVKLSSR
ncbi:hypothetical protein KIH79_09345, partial [Bifidobacterium sp. 82T10]